jgi:hypothetical protein
MYNAIAQEMIIRKIFAMEQKEFRLLCLKVETRDIMIDRDTARIAAKIFYARTLSQKKMMELRETTGEEDRTIIDFILDQKQKEIAVKRTKQERMF